MMKIQRIASCVAGALAVLLCSCATEEYDTERKYIYVDRTTLESKSASEIVSQSIDLEQMEDEKALNVGIRLTVNFMNANDRTRLLSSRAFQEHAMALAKTYLSKIQAYRVVVLPENVKKEELFSGHDFAGVKFHFFVDMEVTLSSELKQGYDEDTALFKTTVNWNLIDNRTKSNGLGALDAPTSTGKAEVCRSMNTMVLRINSLGGGKGLAGMDPKNAQNRFNNALGNALLDFNAQLYNRIPFGGKVRDLWELDGNIYMSLTDAQKMGVVPRMEMLIINERGNKVAIATANGGNNGITLEVWRWLSDSFEKKLTKVASEDNAAEYLKKKNNRLYAISLGMPKPKADEIQNFNDIK